MVEVISFIMSGLSIVGYVIAILSFNRQLKKDDSQRVQERTEIREDIKYLRKSMDEMSRMLQDLTRQNNQNTTKLAEHEVRLTALERWQQTHNKRGD